MCAAPGHSVAHHASQINHILSAHNSYRASHNPSLVVASPGPATTPHFVLAGFAPAPPPYCRWPSLGQPKPLTSIGWPCASPHPSFLLASNGPVLAPHFHWPALGDPDPPLPLASPGPAPPPLTSIGWPCARPNPSLLL